jgi:type II secretory pathway component GspD/PulD (secretin)
MPFNFLREECVMLPYRPRFAFLCLACLAFPVAAQTGGPAKDVETPAEKIRKTLDQSFTLNFAGREVKDVADHLKAKTGVEFTVAADILLTDWATGTPTKFELKSEQSVKLGRALQRCLSRHNMTYVILEDSVVITSEDDAINQQLGQLVSVHSDKVPLAQALKELQRTTPFNLVIDPRAGAEAKTPITMDIDNTVLESAVRLMAELAGLRAVRVDNVLLICDEARFEKVWRAEKAAEQLPAGRRRQPNNAPDVLRLLNGLNGAVPGPVPLAPPMVVPALPVAPLVPPADAPIEKKP